MKNYEWFPNESPDDAGRGQSIRPGSGLKVSILIWEKSIKLFWAVTDMHMFLNIYMFLKVNTWILTKSPQVYKWDLWCTVAGQ